MADRQTYLLFCILLGLGTVFSGWVFIQTILDGLTDFSQATIVDIDIYWKAATRYADTGLLYERFHHMQQGYAPGEPVYKFPPAYQLTLLPFLDQDAHAFFLLQRIFQIAAYLAACAILIISLSNLKKNKAVFIGLSLILVFLSRQFPITFQNTTPECFILLLLAISFWQINNKPAVAGIALSIASAFKIYPVFFLLYPLLAKNYRFIAGFVAGFILTGFASLMLIGMAEHLFYLNEILPILLSEKPMPNSQNLTLESFLTNFHIIEEMIGTTSLIIKWLSLGAILFVGLKMDIKNPIQTRIFFGLLCCGVLMFLSNYWLQYQLILLIPMLLMLQIYLVTQRLTLLLMALPAFLLFIVDHEWGDFIMNIMRELPTHQEITAFVQANPDSNPLLHFAPSVWLVNKIAECRPLLPVFLFIGLLFSYRHSSSA